MARSTSTKSPSKKSRTISVALLLRRADELFVALKKRLLFRLAVLWLAAYLMLLSFYLITILANQNYLEIFPAELTLPLLMHAVTALGVSLIIYWCRPLRLYFAKLISVIVLALLLVDYDQNLQHVAGVIRAFIPGLSANDPLAYVSVVYFALLVLLAVGAGIVSQRLLARLERVRTRDVQFGMLALVGFLFLTPLFSVLDLLPAMVQQARTKPQTLSAHATGPPGAKPDIYYIVLDRYTNAEVLSDQFNYDNTYFTEFLRDRGFRVNDNAYANYPYTAISIASTLNAGYLDRLVRPHKDTTSVQSRTLFHNSIWQSPVIRALKDQGYTYHALGTWYGSTYRAPQASRQYVKAHTIELFGRSGQLHGIEVAEFHKSPYYRFTQLPKVSWWPFKSTDVEHLDIVKQQLGSLEELTSGATSGGRFIFAHILVPHDPFIFNADGSTSDTSGADSIGRPIKQKYLGQVEFVNSQMQHFVERIMKQSRGEAVIVLNADEGPYPWVINGDASGVVEGAINADIASREEDMRTWSDDWLRMKFGILQAAYIPRASDDEMSQLSSVNAFRIILNNYFGYQLDYLPQCHYGTMRGSQNLFNQVDITARLAAGSSDFCREHQSLPK